MITYEQAGFLTAGIRVWIHDPNATYNYTNSFTVNRIQYYKRTPRIKVFLRSMGHVIVEQGVDNWFFTYNPYRVPQPMGTYSYRG